MKIELTAELLKKLLPNISSNAIEDYLPILQELLPKYDITTPERLAGYFAQVGHESASFSIGRENLRYTTPTALRAAFGDKRFPTIELANQYLKQPQKLANYVYGGRMGNTLANDGWLYRGASSIQLTGKENFTKYSHDTYGDDRIVHHPELLEQPLDYIQSGLWYWKKHSLNKYCDKKDLKGMTIAINGALNGYAQRQLIYNNCLKVLGIK